MNETCEVSAPDCNPKEVCCATQTLQQRLTERHRRLSSELADVEAALEAMTKNPEVTDVINKISRVSDRLR